MSIEIKAIQVKELRDKTSAGMMDCKKALIETNGDIALACDWLKKHGLANAAKKTDREANEGAIAIFVNDTHTSAAILELNAETDFVSKNEKFQNLIKKVAKAALDFNGNLSNTAEDLENFKTSNIEDSSINDLISENIAILGENLNLKRVKRIKIEGNFVATYIHNIISQGAGKIGVVVSLKATKYTQELAALGKQIAMHIAAAKPEALTSDALDKNIVAKEREILQEQAKLSGKPDNVIEKIVEGKMQKLYEEIVLLEQVFILDSKIRIKDLLKNFNEISGDNVSITSFDRFTVGENAKNIS